jgi:hypothetical protein
VVAIGVGCRCEARQRTEAGSLLYVRHTTKHYRIKFIFLNRSRHEITCGRRWEKARIISDVWPMGRARLGSQSQWQAEGGTCASEWTRCLK